MSPILLAVLSFVVVAGLFGGVAAMLNGRQTAMHTRLRAIAEPAGATLAGTSVLADERPRSPFEKLLVRLGRRDEKKTADAPVEPEIVRHAKPKRDLRLTLIQAGIRRPNAVALLTGIRMTLAAGVAVLGVLLASVLAPSMMPAAFVFAGTAYVIPGFIVGRMAANRSAKIRQTLPDALDLLLLSVEAGLGLNAAIQRVGEERTEGGPDPMGEELLLVSRELQVGKSRKDALRGLADRSGIDEVRALVAQLIQSERLGSSIGSALRAQSDSLRTARRLEAEEQANKTQIKLLFPLILFIFPSVMIVILMPAVLRLIDALKSLA
jgi:tight adherence protein C